MKKTIALIIGANGKLGHEFAKQLNPNFHTIGTSLDEPTLCDNTILSNLSPEGISEIIKEVYEELPKLIIYIAGFRI
jgi:dTDP-4-dehydrorhamnose reductase